MAHKDITETGEQNFRELQLANNEDFNSRVQQRTAELMNNYRAFTASREFDPEQNSIQNVRSPLYGTKTKWGQSMFDEDTANPNEFAQLQDIRAENQPWYAQLGAGVAKGVSLAVTTFLSGTLGLLYGGASAFKNQSWARLWDNRVTEGLQQWNDMMEEELPNYYTAEEQQGPFWNHIFTANFLGDKLIKNLGFTVGALYSGGVLGVALKATRIPKLIGMVARSSKAPAITTSVTGSLLSAVNEGSIEALNNSREWEQAEIAKLDAENAERVQYIEQHFFGDDRDRELAKQHKAYVNTMAQIQEDKLRMGNMNLLLNIPILTASNLMQFGRYYANGYKTARKEFKLTGKLGELTPEQSKLKGVWAVTKSATSEGLEEMAQSAANRTSGIYYSTDVNNFYKAKTDPNASQDVLDFSKALMQGINETINDNSAWEEFFIGTITGALGAPKFRSMKGPDGKWRVPIGIEGGAIQEWKEYARKMERAQEVADYLNQRVLNTEEFKNYYQGLTRHFKYQNDMNQAVQDGDAFEFKNAEHAQLVSDIAMFDNAGKLEDLKAMINSAYSTSDENLDAIIKQTTTKLEDGKLSGPYAEFAAVQEDGTIASNFGDENSKQVMTDKLTGNKNTIINAIEDYKTSMDKLDAATGQRLSDTQLTELAWMKTQIKNWEERAEDMAEEIREPLSVLSGLLSQDNSMYKRIMAEEGQSSPELTEEYQEADKTSQAIDRKLSLLQKFLSKKNPKNFIGLLQSNPEIVEEFTELIDGISDSYITEDEKITMKDKLKDMVRLGKASQTYVNKLKEYLKDPQKQVKDHIKADEEAQKKEEEKKSNDLKTSLSNASTLKDFREIVESQDDTENVNKVLSEMEESGDQRVKDYRETTQYYNEVLKEINNSDADPSVKNDAVQLLNHLRDNSGNLNEIGNLDSIHITDETFFDEDSDSADTSATRFTNAQYQLQTAMSKVNNDNEFKDKFSNAYKRPIGPKNGQDEKPTSAEDKQGDKKKEQPTPQVPLNTAVGNINSEQLAQENASTNSSVDKEQQETKKSNKYYRPAIPELHIEASNEGDFRPFNEVAKTDKGQYLYVRSQLDDRENALIDAYIKANPDQKQNVQLIRDALSSKLPGNSYLENLLSRPIPNFDAIYRHLEKVGAFTYLNEGNLHVNDEIAFIIDPEFEESVKDEPWHTSPVIFMVDKKSGQVVGSLDSGSSVSRYEGLNTLRKKIIEEYNNRKDKQGKFTATPIVRVSRIMVGKIPYSSEERSLQHIPGVGSESVLGVMQNGTIVANGSEVTSDKIMNLEDMSGKEGRLYLLIPNGAGKYSPAAVRVKHFNKEEFDIIGDVNVTNTPIGEDIKNAITKLSQATSQEDVKEAVKELVQNIYLQNISFEFKEGQGLIIRRDVTQKDSKSVDFNKFTQRTYSPDHITLEIMIPYILNGAQKTFEEIYNSIVEALMNHNLPLQVNARQINTSTYNTRLINSGILTSNLQQATTKGTWFTTSYIDDNGNPQSPVNPASVLPKSKDNTNPIGGTESAIQGTKVWAAFDGKTYYVNLTDNTIKDENGNNVPLTDQNQVLFDIVWADNTYGSSTEVPGHMMDNKVIISTTGRVLDRTTRKYLSDNEAAQVKQAIANRDKQALNNKPSDIKNMPVYPIYNSELDELNPTEYLTAEFSINTGDDRNVGYFVINDKVYKGFITRITTVGGLPIGITRVPNITSSSLKGEHVEPHVASYDYYIVFPNGKTFPIATNVNANKTVEEQKKITLYAANEIEQKSQKAIEWSNERTLIYDPEKVIPNTSSSSNNEPEAPSSSNSGAKNMSNAESLVHNQDGGEDEDDDLNDIENLINSTVVKKFRKEGKSQDYPLWNKEKELNWLKKVLPQLDEQKRVKVIEGLIEVGKHGVRAWGQFDGSIITLSDIAAEGTAYHEAFHAVFNLLLNDNERTSLLNQYRGKHPNMDDISLEEELAEDFREFVIQGGKDTRSLGRKIIDFFKSLFIKTKYWKDFRPSAMYYFKAINEGKYSGKDIPVTTIKEARNKQEEYTKEMKDILAKAPRDSQGRLLAPNGKVSNLTERQYAQVRTKAFKDWFGDWEKEYTPQTNIYKENPWESYMETEDTGRTYVGHSGKTIPIIINKGTKYVHPVERITPTDKDPFGFNSYNVNNLIIVGKEVDADRNFDGICQVTARACKDFLKNRYNIESSVEIIKAKSPVKDAIIDHWVTVLSINGEAYIYDMPQIEYIKQTKPLIYDGKELNGYYEGVIVSKYTPRLIKVTEENLSKFYKDNNKNDKQIQVIKDTIKRLNKDKKSIDLNDLQYKSAYDRNVSKVVDENGEPLVVYHRTPSKFNEFKDEYNNYNSKGGFYFASKNTLDFGFETSGIITKAEIEGTQLYDMPLFINMRNPGEYSEYPRDLEEEYDGGFAKFGTEEVSLEDFPNDFTKRSILSKEEYNVYQQNRLKELQKDKYILSGFVRNSNQIKSATDNIGTFDTNNPDIRYRTVPNSSFEVLRAEEQEMLLKQGWTAERFNSISQIERDYAMRCIAF